MVNVAIFTDNDFGKVNGVTTTLRAVIENAPPDINVRIYTCASEAMEAPHYLAFKAPGIGIPYYREMKMHLPPVRQFLRQASLDSTDLVHLTTPGPVGLAAMWLASRLAIPMVGSFHTHLAEYTARLSGSRRMGTLMQHYLHWSYDRCRQVLAPSEATRRMLVGSRMAPSKIKIWERGVSTTRFDPAKRSDIVRREWQVSTERPAVLYVGRLSREKGLDDLHAVRRSMEARSIAHRFIFVGDGPMRRELQATFTDAVFTGSVSPDRVALFMASSDLFVFPSRTDTAGNVVLEAQASGLPVLVTDEGGPRENIVHGATGFICGSTREMSRQVLELCVRRIRRSDMGASARQYALGRRWEVALAPLYDSYREVAGTPSPAAVTGTAAA